jgi:hypothetical protein
MMLNTEPTEQPDSIFGENSRWLKVCLIIIFLMAIFVRLDEIRAPGYSVTREYNSAILARAFYFENNNNVLEWRRNIANEARDKVSGLEPTVTEYLVSLIYRLLGREELWYARYLTSMFWLLSAVFLYLIARTLISDDVALFAVSDYLFVPIGVKVSRSFQPDSLMMLMFLISLYAIVMYFEKTTWLRLLVASVATGITLLLRPLVLFILFGAYIAASFSKQRRLSGIFDKKFVFFSTLSLVLAITYYGYGIFVSGNLVGQADLSFRPYLLTRWEFWRDWFEMGANVPGHTAVIAALLGLPLIHKNSPRLIVIGMLIGYLMFGLVFNYHIMTHSYYQIQILPVIGICAASLLVYIVAKIKTVMAGYAFLPIVIVILFGLYFSYKEVRESLYSSVFEPEYISKEIGALVNHSPHVVTVAYGYGLPLRYYSEISGRYWREKIEDELYRRPGDKELSVQERLSDLDFTPEYFVITNFNLYYSKHQDLQAYLEMNCKIIAQAEHYLIYGLCQGLTSMKSHRLSMSSIYCPFLEQ